MFNNKKLFFVLIILAFLSISGVSANSYDTSIDFDSNFNYQNDVSLLSVNIDNSLDSKEINSLNENDNNIPNDINVSNSEDDNKTLDIQELINNANEGDNLILPKSYITVTNPIIVDKSLNIDGKSSTIDGKGLSQLFIIQANNVILKNLNFINGFYPNNSGGAIFWNGDNGIIYNCTFVNNSAYRGGAIFWNGSNGIVSSSTFKNNRAGHHGGAINWNGEKGIVKKSYFMNNSAPKGGAINWDEDNGLVTSSYFVKNKAYKGGAIYWDEPTGKISNSSFIKNFAYKGGAIYLEDGEIDIEDCHFSDNHVDNIYIEDDDDDDDDKSDSNGNKFPLENTGIPIVLLIVSLLCVVISFKSKL